MIFNVHNITSRKASAGVMISLQKGAWIWRAYEVRIQTKDTPMALDYKSIVYALDASTSWDSKLYYVTYSVWNKP
jgi:hypothetical protein